MEQKEVYKNNRYEIVSRVGYLIGVSENFFVNDTTTLDKSVYEKLNMDVNARVVRNLSIVRTCLFRYYTKIESLLCYDIKNIDSIPDYIPSEIISGLKNDGVEIWHTNYIMIFIPQ